MGVRMTSDEARAVVSHYDLSGSGEMDYEVFGFALESVVGNLRERVVAKADGPPHLHFPRAVTGVSASVHHERREHVFVLPSYDAAAFICPSYVPICYLVSSHRV